MAQTDADDARSDVRGHYEPRVIVKFREHVQIPYEDGAERHILELGLGPWGRLEGEFPGISLVPLFASIESEKLQELTARATREEADYRPAHLFGYFAVKCPHDIDLESLAKQLASWRSVETAYVEPEPVEPPVVNPADDPRWPNQGYLDPAPDGIDAEYAWPTGMSGVAGGDGAGIGFVDLEWGWTLNHEDLAAHGTNLISGINNSYFFHGTSVLSEVASVDNGVGCVGIAPACGPIGVVSQWLSGGGYSTSQPILDAIAVMSFGDVLLLEAQTAIFGYSKVPVETEPAVWDVIRLATALGIVVVEAAGNGGVDLDTVVVPGSGQVFNRSSADFRDSGAIIVGAASSAAPHIRLGFSCYGSRIDCYGWGENIDAASTDGPGTATNMYTTGFNGTSGASPIVTGAAIVVQGIAQSNLGYRFSPWQLRTILSDPATGTASANPATDRIGLMPNLRAIVQGSVLNLAPDIYLRDYVGDIGDPHSGAISASPDVILRQTAVANPQTEFGVGSGTENSNTLGSTAEQGQDNFVYVRGLNRGGSAAANVEATVYWAPVATLLTPDLWNLVGQTTIPIVPAGNVLTVSDAIVWSAADIPASGHYCFVCLLGSAQDPAPGPADYLNWSNFQAFIRTNNNVTWRNVNVENNVPPPAAEPPGYVPLPFLATGAPDKAREFALAVVSRLPRGAKLLLEAAPETLEALGVRSRNIGFGEDRKTARVPLNPSGRQLVGESLFPAKARFDLRLLVHIPEELREHAFELHAAQLYKREEVGRVTWRLAPKERQRP
jgi:serine protease